MCVDGRTQRMFGLAISFSFCLVSAPVSFGSSFQLLLVFLSTQFQLGPSFNRDVFPYNELICSLWDSNYKEKNHVWVCACMYEGCQEIINLICRKKITLSFLQHHCEE